MAADETAVDAVLTASRTLVGVATRSMGAAAQETTIAQYRALVVLASRGPQRMVDLARLLEVTPSTAGRMCDRLLRKGLVRRRALLAGILGRLSAREQLAVASAFRAFARAAGEIPDSEWPAGPDEPGPEEAAAKRSKAGKMSGSRS